MNPLNVLRATGIFVVWFAAAYLLNGLLIWLLVIAIMDGFAEPPALWLGVHWFGVNVLPPIFLVGGLPSAVQALRGRPFKSTLLISVCAFSLAWLPVLATVFWLPRILGWSW